MKLSRKAVAIRAALGTFLRSHIAQDAALLDLGALVKDVKSATIASDSARIVAAVAAKVPDVDQQALAAAIKFAADAEPEDDEMADDEAQRPDESDEDYAKRKKPKQANDKAPVVIATNEPHGMNAKAVQDLIAADRAATVAQFNALRQAEIDVKPLLGEVLGQDSASGVYKMALDHLKIDVTGVDPSAYGAMVKLALSAKPNETPVVAMDAAAGSTFASLFPSAGKLKGAF